MLGRSTKSSRARVLLNCGPVSSASTVDTSCPEFLVRYLLTRFVHILRGVLLCSFFVCFVYIVVSVFSLLSRVCSYIRTRADLHFTGSILAVISVVNMPVLCCRPAVSSAAVEHYRFWPVP